MSHFNSAIILLVHVALPTRNIITIFNAYKCSCIHETKLQNAARIGKFRVKLTSQMSDGFKIMTVMLKIP